MLHWLGLAIQLGPASSCLILGLFFTSWSVDEQRNAQAGTTLRWPFVPLEQDEMR